MEQTHDRELLAIAMDRVGRRVQPHNLEAFRLMALEGVPPREAADRLGMKIGTAYAARASVQRLIREEVTRLDPAES